MNKRQNVAEGRKKQSRIKKQNKTQKEKQKKKTKHHNVVSQQASQRPENK